MNERAGQILESAIQEFINAGEPVSSGWLYKQYDFGIKPAMIRLELDALEEAGYLGQPYHSAGRVPTDLGYEFYAERALAVASRAHVAAHAAALRNSRAVTLHDLLEQRAWAHLTGELSAELGLLSIAVDFARDAIYKVGLEALIEHLNWEDHEGIRSVIRDFETVDERLPRAAEKISDGPQVFIGKKSPVTKSENLSVVGSNYKVGNAMVSIFAIGPKRMNYRKTIRIFKNL